MNPPNEITTTIGVTLQGDHQVLPGRPLFTIASLVTTAALILTALAAAGLTLAGALPADLANEGAAIARGAAIAGAVALAAGGLGKSLYAIAKAQATGPLPLIQEGKLPDEPRVPTFGD